MSNQNYGYGSIPEDWLHCPQKANRIIGNMFYAFKTPLCSGFDDIVPATYRFSVNMIFSSLISQNAKMGLWIDLTNTSRYYNKNEVEKYGCKYVKFPCKGHGEAPDVATTQNFIQLCKKFKQDYPSEIIGVHCTHGFNRTGSLIISYLVEELEISVNAALTTFSVARPPGIYKFQYIEELYRRYHDVKFAPPAPSKPNWSLHHAHKRRNGYQVNEYHGENSWKRKDGDESLKKRNYENVEKVNKPKFEDKIPVFMTEVPGITPVTDYQISSEVKRRMQNICAWNKSGFPGSQSIFLNIENISLLKQKPYRVSWTTNGTRYMLLIQSDGCVYLIDQDSSVFEVAEMIFPYDENMKRILRDTLLDGEMVIDTDSTNEKEYLRFLVHDVIMYDGEDVSNNPFYPVRYNILENDVVAVRRKALEKGLLHEDQATFIVQRKSFWALDQSAIMLDKDFAKQLGHKPVGLVFQPANSPYVPGKCPGILKWKPPSTNSVEFKLKIVTEYLPGLLPMEVGHLYVGDDIHFATIKINKEMEELDNKIIECEFSNNQWIFIRERTDKLFPNSYNTAKAVCETFSEPVTTETLLAYIKNVSF